MKVTLGSVPWYPQVRQEFRRRLPRALPAPCFSSLTLRQEGAQLVSLIEAQGLTISLEASGLVRPRFALITPCCHLNYHSATFGAVTLNRTVCAGCAAYFPAIPTYEQFYAGVHREELLAHVPLWLGWFGTCNVLEAELVAEPLVDGLLSYRQLLLSLQR